MKKPFPLQQLKIENLFGDYNIDIDFENFNIFIGENGIGKTTILNCIYYILSGNLDKLFTINFKNISFIYKDKEYKIKNISYEKNTKLNKFDNDHKFFTHFHRAYLERKFITKKKINLDQPANSIKNDILSDITDILEHRYFNEEDDNIEKYKKEVLRDLDKYSILYFPTYRRIEKDLTNIIDEISLSKIELNVELHNLINNSVIQFGMQDVKQSINNTLRSISAVAAKGLNNLTEKLFSHLFEDTPTTISYSYSERDRENLEIIIERLKFSSSQDHRNKIRQLMSQKTSSTEFIHFFIKNLLEIYKNQEKYDMSIRKFVETCNSYFENKYFKYDEKNIKLTLFTQNEKVIDLSQLSSGEKQIVSLFSKIYLYSNNPKNIVLFDEPELSLSIFWQKNILKDIIKSDKCDFMVAVTHSPFIFENLHEYTSSLRSYIK